MAAVKVYVLKDRDLIESVEDNDIEGFKKSIEDEEYIEFEEPIEFETESEALAFCAGLGYGVDERAPIEILPLRSFEEYDRPFINEIEKYI